MSHAEVCPVCRGRGEVQDILYTGMTVTASVNFVQCRSCSGKGWVTVDDSTTPWYSYTVDPQSGYSELKLVT